MPARAKVFMSGRSQAVRLPKEFRLDAAEVHVRRVGRTLVLEPIEHDVEKWFAEMHAITEGGFPDRDQPSMPPDDPNLTSAFGENANE